MDPEARVGDLVEGRYRIDRVVGQGGFGVVYEARHLVLDKRVALKVVALPEALPAADKIDRASRLLEEARLLSRLRHPHVVAAVDSGLLSSSAGDDETAAAQPYLVVEWCDGPTLKTWLASGGRAGVANAWSIVGPLAAAIASAHELGIVHRDLKPSNVMLDGDGATLVPKLIDFGIAKLVAADAPAGTGDTRTDSTFKPYTPAYAAPEQIAGARTGTWTDVHALALLFTEIATGKAPYGAEAGLGAIDPDRPTPSRLGVDVGPFEPVLARALSLRPADRFPDGGAFAAALAAAAARHGLAPSTSIAALPSRPAAAELARADGADDRSEGPASVTIASMRSGAGATTTAPTRRLQWLVVVALVMAGVFGGTMLAREIASTPSTPSALPTPSTRPGSPSSSAQPLASLSGSVIAERVRSVAPILTSSESGGQADVTYGDAASSASLSRTNAVIPLGLGDADRERMVTRVAQGHLDAGAARAESVGVVVDEDTVLTVRDPDPARAERVLDAVLAGRVVAFRRVFASRAAAVPTAKATRVADLGPTELAERAAAAGLTVDAQIAGGTLAAQMTVRTTSQATGTLALHRLSGDVDGAVRHALDVAAMLRTPFVYARDGDALLIVQGGAPFDADATARALLVGLGAKIERSPTGP